MSCELRVSIYVQLHYKLRVVRVKDFSNFGKRALSSFYFPFEVWFCHSFWSSAVSRVTWIIILSDPSCNNVAILLTYLPMRSSSDIFHFIKTMHTHPHTHPHTHTHLMLMIMVLTSHTGNFGIMLQTLDLDVWSIFCVGQYHFYCSIRSRGPKVEVSGSQ